MNVIVGGAGAVGAGVARALRDEGHDVTVIEQDAARLERLTDLDVQRVQGNLASRTVLELAKIQDTQLFVACGGDDAQNMVACALAKEYGARTIARLNDTEYLSVPVSDTYKSIGIDVAVSPELAAAIRIKRMLSQPTMMDADVFAQGRVTVAEGRVAPDAFIAGKLVGEIEAPEGFHLFCIYRGDDAIIPRSSTRFQVHDRLLMAVTSAEVLDQVQPYLGGKPRTLNEAPEVKRVMVAGATRVGIHLARLLEQAKRDVVLIEQDPERARWASEQLDKALVVLGEATDRRILAQENVDTFDAFVAATRGEEYNVLAAILAKQLGATLTVALVHQPELKPALEAAGIDLAVAPRLTAVSAILRQIHPTAQEMALQNLGEERLLVYTLKESGAAGHSIRELGLPRDAIVAAVVRGDRMILPHGDDKLEVGDTVVCFALGDAVAGVEKAFA